MSQIQNFYQGLTIFVTGGTGFLGKILIEKLLRSCPDIGTIYVLVRDKKGKNVQERVDALLDDSVFEVLRNENFNFLKKVVAVNGDICKEGLGLSIQDYGLLVNEVSVIFHLAATIRFNEKIGTAVDINVNSVKYIVDIAKACKNLKAAIYVSTAYSNCVRETIEEVLYPPPLSYQEINRILEDVKAQKLSEIEMTNFTEKLIGKWPNTYTFTKAIAEDVVKEFAKDIPFAVYRPSIVVSAYREPMPGWVDGPMGVAGLFGAIGLGIDHICFVDDDLICDVVPVDYVCNALIACAWETASTERRDHEDVPVYNYISGRENALPWEQFTTLCVSYGRIFPPLAAVYYMTLTRTKSRHVFVFLEFFFHLLPAFIIDSVARLFGKPPRLYKAARKIGEALNALAYFGTHQWNFENHRVQNLWKSIGPDDKRIFPFSMRDLDWDEHILRMVKGVRKYILGEADDTIKEARRRYFYLHIIHTTVCLTFGIVFLWILWKSFCERIFQTVLVRSASKLYN